MSDTSGNGVSGTIHFDEGVCERYIFGELDAEEQERFEAEYFADDAFFNRFCAVKDELLDLYARGELDPDRRGRMEPHFKSTPPRRRRIQDSRNFVRSITVISDRHGPLTVAASLAEAKQRSLRQIFQTLFTLPRLATVSGLIIATGVGFWLLTRSASPDRAVDGRATQSVSVPQDEITSQGNTPSNDVKNGEPKSAEERAPKRLDETETAEDRGPEKISPAQKVSPEAADPQQPSVAENQKSSDPKPDGPKPADTGPEITVARTETVTLSSASRSVTARNSATIGAATRSVLIRMLFSGEAYPGYSVRITTLGGETVWRTSGLKTGMNTGAKSLAVTVPAAVLTKKDYIVVLEGRSSGGKPETVREFYLHVDRR